MHETMLFPPSPALSECDSLDGIDDLDAFLASQGKLSHFPTPPSQKKDTIIINTEEILDSSSEYSFDDNMDHENRYHEHLMTPVYSKDVIKKCRQQADLNGITSDSDNSKLLLPMMNARMPHEILQLAYSILRRLRDRHENGLLPNHAYTTDWDLWVVTAWMLAADYLEDNPHNLSWWRLTFYNDQVELLTLSEAKIELLKCIDWALHACASREAMYNAFMAIPPMHAVYSSEVHATMASRVNSRTHEQSSAHRRVDSAVDDVAAQLDETRME